MKKEWKHETWFSWRHLAKCKVGGEGVRLTGGRKDGEGKSQWTRKEIFKKTSSRGEETVRKEEKKWVLVAKTRPCPSERMSEDACMWWNDNVSAAHLLRWPLRWVAMMTSTSSLTSFLPLCISLSVSCSLCSLFVSPPPNSDLHKPRLCMKGETLGGWAHWGFLENVILGFIAFSLSLSFSYTFKMSPGALPVFPFSWQNKSIKDSGRIQEVSQWKEPA